MIKPIKITPLNITNTVCIECSECKFKGEVCLENRTINTDSDFDMEDLLFEECPKCHSMLTEKKELIRILNHKIFIANIILDGLNKNKSNNLELITEYKKALQDYLESKDFKNLGKLSSFFHRATNAGENTDYTEATGIKIEGRYYRLDEFILSIERLLAYVKPYSRII